MHEKTHSAGKRHHRENSTEVGDEPPCVRLSVDSAHLKASPPPKDVPANDAPLIRLEVTQKHVEVLPEPAPAKEAAVRLEQLGELDAPPRTHEPSVEAIVNLPNTPIPTTEELWENEKSKGLRTIPIGWIILPSLILLSGLLWSLNQWKIGNDEIREIQRKVEIQHESDEKEKKDATRLINSIHATLGEYFKCTTVAELGSYVRHPERVLPLMRSHYKDQAVFIGTVSSIHDLRPLHIDHQSRFWAAAAILSNGHKPLINVEVTPAGAVLIDWESLVCYQSMNWTDYAQKRPAGTTMDFRVYGEPIAFNTHEFKNAREWLCIRLTAYDSIEFLFGYARVHSEVGLRLRELLKKNNLQKSTLTLRLTLPDGLQSPRGVIIDEILSPGWIYLDPPNTSLLKKPTSQTDSEIEIR